MPVSAARLLIPGALALLTALLTLTGCQETGRNGQVLDTPTSGAIQVAVDETFRPIIESHVDTFQKLYTNATVRAIYGSEAAVSQRFMASDSVRAVILARRLTAAEEAEFVRLKLVPATTRIAVDAVAIILHPSNPDSLLHLSQLEEMLNGKLTNWAQLNPASKLGEVNVVFDNSGSSTTRFLRDSVLRGTPLTARASATKSVPALIDYVATHPGAVGVLGVGWISDGDDQQVKGFQRRIKVAGLTAKHGAVAAGEYYKPYQAYIALRQYPLCRELFIITREARNGLGLGFASFVAGDKGQRIFLKAGLVPGLPVRREVQFAPGGPPPQ